MTETKAQSSRKDLLLTLCRLVLGGAAITFTRTGHAAERRKPRTGRVKAVFSQTHSEVTTTVENGKSRVEISGSGKTTVRTYDFPVSVESNVSSVNGKETREIRISREDGTVVEVIRQ
jgi:hypothetical protein